MTYDVFGGTLNLTQSINHYEEHRIKKVERQGYNS